MKLHTAQYVNISELMDGLNLIWQEFTECGDYPWSWGDNELTLIDAEDLWDFINKLERSSYDKQYLDQFDVFSRRINKLPAGCLINLES